VDLVVTDHQDDPTVGGLIVVGRDLTTRAEMEGTLRRSHDDLAALNRRLTHGRAVLQALFDGLDDGLLLLDGAGHVQVASRALAVLLGTAPDALHDRPWPEIARRLSPDAPAALTVPAPGERIQQRLRYQDANGAIRVLDVSIAVADGTDTLADGAIPTDAARVIVRVTDATETVQMRERALLGERFAAGGRLAPETRLTPPEGNRTGVSGLVEGRGILMIGALAVGPSRHEVRFQDQPMTLTRMEYALLRRLAEHPGQMQPYDELAQATHGLRLPLSEARALLHTHVVNLRRKLDPAYLVTDPGAGYMLVDPRENP